MKIVKIKRPRKAVGFLVTAMAFVAAAVVSSFCDDVPSWLNTVFDGAAGLCSLFGIAFIPPQIDDSAKRIE